MKRFAMYIKMISLTLVCVLLAAAFCSCVNNRVVGTVGEYEVAYDELRFLANSYKTSLVEKYGEYETLDDETKSKFESELRELVYTNIVTNYAILSLCADEGLTLEDEDLDKRVDEYMDELIEGSFGGSRSDYKASMKMYSLTDRYVKFTVAVDYLYSDLLSKMLESSPVSNDDAKMKEIVKNEFARTWHIAIFNDEGESVEDNKSKAIEALSKLRDGSMTMYKLIGSKYNEDYSITDLDGLYFARGSMNEDYEKVAFGLEVGEISDIVGLSVTRDNGKATTAFYIIQRLEIEDAYLDENIDSLRQEYMNSIIYGMLEERKGELSFEPNKYCEELVLAELK